MALTMLPCYEGKPHSGGLSPFHRLHGHMGAEELWEFLVALCEYGVESKRPRTLTEAVECLLKRKTAVLAGGLIAVKDKYKLFPSCCCGLESWREWTQIVQDGPSPWLGHDPDPWVDTKGSNAIFHNGLKVENEDLEVSYSDLKRALIQTEKEFAAFLTTLRKWLIDSNIRSADEVCRKIDKWFLITHTH